MVEPPDHFDPRDDALADDGVLRHLVELVAGELCRLVQDGAGDPDLADVMECRCDPDGVYLSLGQPQLLGERDGVPGPAVAPGPMRV